MTLILRKPNRAYAWCVYHAEELVIELLDHTPSAWLDFECKEDNFEGILRRGDWRISLDDWALAQGLAPGQVFIMELEEPTYYDEWTDTGLECDCRLHEVCIVWKAPMAPEEVARRWEEVWGNLPRIEASAGACSKPEVST